MTLETQEKEFFAMTEKMQEVMFSKGNDYANTDRLSNFKLAGQIAGLTPELNCLSLIATKVARLGVLLNAKTSPNNESIQDSILDLANYSLLLSMILNDNDCQPKSIVKEYVQTQSGTLPFVSIKGQIKTY